VVVACSITQASQVKFGRKLRELRYIQAEEEDKVGIGYWGLVHSCFRELEVIFEENQEENKI
jgi:hypothetical protein